MRKLTRGRLLGVAALMVPVLIGAAVEAGPGYAAGGTQLLVNGGFESGGGSLTGWTSLSSKLAVATDGDGGGHAALAKVNGKSKPPAYGLTTASAPVSGAPAGEVFTANARVRSATPGRSICLVVRELSPSGTAVQTRQQCANGTAAWASLPAVSLTVATTGDSLAVTVQQLNGVAGDGFEADNVSLVDADTTAPGAPGTFTATASSTTAVALSWQLAGDTGGAGVAKYVVSRGGSPIATLGPTATSYADSGLTAGTPYSYSITATDYAGNVSAPASTSATTLPDLPPSVPGALAATASSPTRVELSWTSSTDTDGTGVAGYVVSRDGSALATLGSNATSYADTTVSASTTYSYTVKAFDTANQYSDAAGPASATTPAPPPDEPPSVPGSLTASAASSSRVDLAWTASTDTDATGLAGYVVSRNGNQIATLGPSATSYADTTVAASTSYSYTVKAFDTASNYSADTPSATVTTPAPPADNPPTVPAGFSATAVSAGEVDLRWTASTDTDATGLAGYQITRNGSVLTTVGPTSVGYVDFAVSPSTTYTYSVKAYDTAGNFSAATANASATTPAGSSSIVDSLWHMDETSGTTMVDSGTTPHNGILKNVTLGQPGDPAFPGTAYFFNGSADPSKWASTTGSAIDLGTANDLNAGTKDVRIAFSLKTSTVPPAPDYDLFRKGEYPGTEYKIEMQPNGQLSCEFRTLQADGSTVKGYTIQPAVDLHDGVWHRITCSKVGTTMTVTIDGARFTKSITGSISNPYHVVVGAYSPSGSGDAYRGLLDELSFKIG